jgi:hypothetical protein
MVSNSLHKLAMLFTMVSFDICIANYTISIRFQRSSYVIFLQITSYSYFKLIRCTSASCVAGGGVRTHALMEEGWETLGETV